MVERALIKKLIAEYQRFVANISYIPRDIAVDMSHCNVFVGLRRAGKSYLMYQCIDAMIKSGRKPEEILYMNFEDDRLPPLETGDLDIIKTSYEEMYAGKPVFFLDELQVVAGWEKFARRLADTGYQVFITGSNASMLSSEIATTLGGRYAMTEVFPFSFGEFLKANGETLPGNWQYMQNSGIKRLFNDYFHLGGLPELTSTPGPFKRKWLSGLFDRIYFGDLVARNGIRKPSGMKMLIRKLVESVGQPLSVNRVATIVSATGEVLKADTAADYLTYAKTSWLTFSMGNYEGKLTERVGNRKYYFIDNGLITLFRDEMHGELLENVVAVNLRKIAGDRVYYFKHNIEVDFFLPDSRTAVQVSYSVDNEATLSRELAAFDALSARYPLDRCLLITFDDERELATAGGLPVSVVPVWKWLLTSEG